MDKLKPYQRIASLFQVSNESAKYFLNHVQKSFKTERPGHALIVDFVQAQKFEFLLTPYEVAALMVESGVWVHELGSPPPLIVDEADLEIE